MQFRTKVPGIGFALNAVVLFRVLANLLTLTGVVYLMQVYDRVLASHSVSTLAVLTAIAIGLFIAQGLLKAITGTLTERIGHRLLIAHEPTLLVEASRRVAQGRHARDANAPVKDLMAYVRAIRGGSLAALLDLPWSTIFLIGLALIAPWLGAFALAVVVLMIAVVVAHGWMGLEPLPEDDEDANAKRAWDEALRGGGGNAAASMAALGQQVALARQSRREGERAGREADRDGREFLATFRNLAQSGMLAIGAWLVINGHITLGLMMASNILIGRVLTPIEAVLRERRSIFAAAAARRRLRSLKLSVDKSLPTELAANLTSQLLTVEGVTIAAPTRNAVRVCQNIRLSVEPGRLLVVMGASGVGKSLLLRVLAGLQPPAAGSIRLGDVRLNEFDVNTRDEIIGYLPQDDVFLPGTLHDAVARYDPAVSRATVIDACKRVAVHEEIMGLTKAYETPLPQTGRTLPFRFMRRLALARAICRQPHLLVLDDPLISFDVETLHILTKLLSEHKGRNGITIAAGYHPILQDLADQTIVLANGTMSIAGPPGEVFKARTIAAGRSRKRRGGDE